MSGITSVSQESSWIAMFTWIAQVLGISSQFTSLISVPFLWDSAKLLILGSFIETGRRLFRWAIQRFHLRWSISAEFRPGTPTHDWLVAFLTKEGVWRNSYDFVVQAKSSQRKLTVKQPEVEHGQVDYIPAYGSVHFFRWKGYWLELRGSGDGHSFDGPPNPGFVQGSTLYLILYTLDVSVLFAFVEDCRSRYIDDSKPHVVVHSADSGFGDPHCWNNVKKKHRRPLDSLLLDEGAITSLLADAREFLDTEDWYIKAGIPHRRGYLLHGPPGTGKTSTVYTVAGELGLEIYTLSLAASGMDDNSLSRVVSSLPPRGILLIEDIDCAFPSRDDEDDELAPEMLYPRRRGRSHRGYVGRRSQITLSGLLNVLDGIGSEEGKIFFATTNHIDRLDAALLRPGRIDRKIEYKLGSTQQARSLFNRFFPASRFTDLYDVHGEKDSQDIQGKRALNTEELAQEFARAIPEHEFSVAELQGYLLSWKTKPLEALHNVQEWAEHERDARRAQEERERLRKAKMEAARVKEQLNVSEAVIMGIGTAMSQAQAQGHGHGPPPAVATPSNFTPGLVNAEPSIVTYTSGSGTGLANTGSSKPLVNGAPHTPPVSPDSREVAS